MKTSNLIKKTIIKIVLLGITIVCSNNIMSAQGAYIKVNAGYNSSLGSPDLFGSNGNTTATAYSSTTKYKKLALGKGFEPGVSAGYMFNEHIGVELGISYLIGSVNKFQYTNTDPNAYRASETDEFSANMLKVHQSIIIVSGLKKINPYAKLGLLTSMGSIKMKFTENNNLSDDIEETTKYSGKMGIGFSGAFGVLIPVSKKSGLFVEINTNNLVFTPKKGTLTEYKENGIDKLSTKTTSEKEVEFSNEVTHSNSTMPNPTEPTKSLKMQFPLAATGILIGFRIGL